jgi:hypothetical protein
VHRPEADRHTDTHKKCTAGKSLGHGRVSEILTVTHEGHHVDILEGPGVTIFNLFCWLDLHFWQPTAKGENAARKPFFQAMMVHIQTAF